MRVVVLRLGHRPERDKRITTHIGLVSRAFGAEEMLLVGRDPAVKASLDDVADRWGGDFRVVESVRWKDEVRDFREAGGRVVHLTMYGSRLGDVLDEVRRSPQVMVVVGAEKVPAQLYGLADWNVAVGNQPHSEVAALAIFLDRLWNGAELEEGFESRFPGQIRVVPTARGKLVLQHGDGSSGGGGP
ncbi:MAG: tRNA (cytidine(56)-2'-O)-methyltransferase [Methanosaeta sp. PtaU1.Bin028]|nr:MAG: tRNA (cytidine(56)-2'-O)-methyltransferase [Methanosaeta sp. PtaU1.Bin028]